MSTDIAKVEHKLDQLLAAAIDLKSAYTQAATVKEKADAWVRLTEAIRLASD